jgi:oxalate decarboxylase/phosphoglucose isomerase-like protein (cupin superfamily)
MSEPLVTGTKNMTTGYIVVEPGKGHGRHNHEGCEEILYILEGKAKQMIDLPDGIAEKEMAAGELAFIPAGAFHSTLNVGGGKLVFLAIYQFAGPEAALRADPGCKIIPPKNA